MNARRILDVLAVIFVGDGLLWVVAPRSRGLIWHAGPRLVKRFVERVTLERPHEARLIGAVQVAIGAWMARRAYAEK